MNLFKLTTPENIHYKYALNQEIQRATDGNAAPHAYPPSIDLHPLINKHRNKSRFDVESDKEDGWYQFLKREIKPVKLALSLGSGDGRHEKRLTEIGVVDKWMSVDLAENPLDVSSNSGENEFLYGDLNFMELPENKFDLVYCNAFLHHIVNLEHLLSQIFKALTPNGVLVVYEYAGENKWQWDEEKFSLLKKEVNENLSKQISGISYKRKPVPFMSERPFESIRSSELHKLINNLFSPKFESRWNRIIYPMINGIVLPRKYRGNLEIDKLLIERAIELETMHKDNAALLPTELNGIYQKSTNPIITAVTPWTDIEIKQNLGKIDGSIAYRLKKSSINTAKKCYQKFKKLTK